MSEPEPQPPDYFISPPPRRFGVLALLDEGQGHLGLIRRGYSDEVARWGLPGGHREPGESWEQTARREVAEETGIVLEAVSRVDVDRHRSQQVPPAVFRAQWDGPEQDLVVGEGQALRFFDPGRLPTPIPPHIGHYIRQTAGVARPV